MKNSTVFILVLLLAAMPALTTATAQQYSHTATLTASYSSNRVAFKDNETLISADSSRNLRAWDVNTGAEQWNVKLGNRISAIALPTHDPSFVAYGGGATYIIKNADFTIQGNSIQTRHTSNGKWRAKVGWKTQEVSALAFKPNSYLLASGYYDGSIRIWSVKPGNNEQLLHILDSHTRQVRSLAWSPDGRTLASGSTDDTVRLWNPDTGANLAVLRGHDRAVRAVVWSPNGQTLVSAGNDNTVRIWHPDTHETLRVLRGHTGDVNALAFHPDGQTLASGGTDRAIRLWNPNNGNLKNILRTTRRVQSLVFSPNGQTLAVGTDTNRSGEGIQLWTRLIVDVTGDGSVTFEDLIVVSRNYGKTVADGADSNADVNKDGKVDIDDLVAVAKGVDAAAAPVGINTGRARLQAADVHQWLRDAKQANTAPEGIAALERLLAALTHVEAPPKETALLANYPNPFNPETWIPFRLGSPEPNTLTDVTLSIYTADGKLVRTLDLGQLPAGVYQTKAHAAYWDGRNAQGEPVASGVYFYTLMAGNFTATKNMVIRK